MTKTFEGKSADCEFLSREAVQQLHKQFNDDLEEKARKALPQNAVNQSALLAALKSLLVEAARKGVTLKADTLAELAAQGSDAVEGQAEKIARNVHAGMPVKSAYISPRLSDGQKRQIEKSAAERKAIAAVAVLFGDEERIYLRLNGTEEESETQQCIAAYLEEKGYRITDYGGGYATDAAGRQQFRIGKLLKGEADLYAAFCNDSSRTLGRLLVVVSRNAMDIALMSTGRAWSSCMGSGGFNWPYVPRDVSEGALVTYLISEKDPDILNPLARILLLPFREKMKKPGLLARAAQKVFGRKSAEAAPQQIYLANKAYGLHNESFIKTVDDFVESTFNGGKTGRFFIADGLYPDMLTHIVVRKKPRVPRPQ